MDAEIAVPRPPRFLLILADCLYLRMGYYAVRNLLLHSLGIPAREVRAYVPDSEFPRMFWSARAVLALQLIPVALAVVLHSWLPVLFFGLPRLYGAIVGWNFIALQHAGLAENVWDHRLNTRSLRFNFILSCLYMHMENHLEHHIYPLVPFHALPKLRVMVKAQLPAPYRGLVHGTRELLPVLLRQKKDPTVFIHRPLP